MLFIGRLSSNNNTVEIEDEKKKKENDRDRPDFIENWVSWSTSCGNLVSEPKRNLKRES